MQRYRLDLILRRAEGALARVIGTAERRGFQPVGVDGSTDNASQAGSERWSLRLIVEGERSGELLKAQLAKLYDCLAVEVSSCR